MVSAKRRRSSANCSTSSLAKRKRRFCGSTPASSTSPQISHSSVSKAPTSDASRKSYRKLPPEESMTRLLASAETLTSPIICLDPSSSMAAAMHSSPTSRHPARPASHILTNDVMALALQPPLKGTVAMRSRSLSMPRAELGRRALRPPLLNALAAAASQTSDHAIDGIKRAGCSSPSFFRDAIHSFATEETSLLHNVTDSDTLISRRI
mmetsp:Transcript_15893/g.53560  ORF Transcript_15893/g.53560 Transcript_15893/m.53560 type:complete len:209 (+) Transcript_15893:28-654(+)